MGVQSNGAATALGTAIGIFLVSFVLGDRTGAGPLSRLSASLLFGALAFAVSWTLHRYV